MRTAAAFNADTTIWRIPRTNKVNRDYVGIFCPEFHFGSYFFGKMPGYISFDNAQTLFYFFINPVFNFLFFFISKLMIAKKIYAQTFFSNITPFLFYSETDDSLKSR